MAYHLGIDVGTTWTAAAAGRDGRVETVSLGTRRQAVPSVVCLTDDRLLVGEAAARRSVTDPHRVAREFKRRVGDPTPLLLGGTPVSAELCMARMAAWVADQVTTTEEEPPASLTVTHPANWGEYKLDLYRQALHHAGLTADHLVPEPVAAAITHAAQRPMAPGATVAVFDLGGGTFDAAVVRAGDRSSHADVVGRPDGGAALFRDDDGSPTAAPSGGTTTTGEPSGSTTTAGETTSGTLARLPGDDWNEAARAQFVRDCGPYLRGAVSLAGSDTETVCNCIYDEAAGARDFDAFNDMWTSPELDPGSDELRFVTNAALSCTPGLGG